MSKTIIPLAQQPAYKVEAAKLAELEAQERKLQASLDAANQQQVEDGTLTVEQRADRLLKNKDPKAISTMATRPPDLATIRDNLQIVRAAIHQQKTQLAQLRREISRQVANECAPHHAAIVKQIFAGVVELSKACAAEEKLRLELRDADYSDVLRPMAFAPLAGSIDTNRKSALEDHQSLACHFIRECVEFGFIEHTDSLVKQTAAISGGEEFLPHVRAKKEAEAAVAERNRKADEAARATRLVAQNEKAKRVARANNVPLEVAHCLMGD